MVLVDDTNLDRVASPTYVDAPDLWGSGLCQLEDSASDPAPQGEKREQVSFM